MSDRTSSQADLLRSLAPAEPQQSQADKLRMLVDPTWNDVVRQAGESLVTGAAGVVDAAAGLDQRVLGAISPVLANVAPTRAVRGVTKPYLEGAATRPAVTGEGERFYAQVLRGMGSSAAMAPAALAGPAGVGLMGAAVGAEQGIEQAQAAGAGESDTVYAALGEALLGYTERFGAGRALSRFGLKPGTAAYDIVKDIVEEFAQESGQNIGSDVLAGATYDPQRKVDLGKALEAGLAASVGAGLISGTAAVSSKQADLLRASAPVVDAEAPAAPVPASEPTRTWAREFAAQHGANLEFVDTLPDKARGRYDEKGKRIELSSNLTDEEVIRGTVLHEVARHMKATMGDTWQGMTERIREQDPVWWQKAGERYQADRAAAVGAASPESFDEDATSRYVDMAHGYILAAIEGKATPQPGILRSIADAVIRVLQKIGVRIDTSTEKALREYAASPWEKARDPKTMQAVAGEIAKAFQALQESAGKSVEDQAAAMQTEAVPVASTGTDAPPPAPPATAAPEAGAGGVSFSNDHIDTIGRGENKMELVARDSAGKPIGVAEYTQIGDQVSIDMVTVREDMRRRGIAKRIIEEVRKANPQATVNLGIAVSEAGEALRKSAEAAPSNTDQATEPLAPAREQAPPSVEEQHAKLRAMASVAGWDQEGGKAFLSTMAEREPGQHRGRQHWVARDPWWEARPENLRLNEAQTKSAVRRHIAGEKLTPKERKFIDWMLSYEEAPAPASIDPEMWRTEAEKERLAIQGDHGENTDVEGVPFAVEPRKIIGYDLTGEPVYEEKPKVEKAKPTAPKEVQGGLFTPKQKQAFGLGDTEVEKPRGKYAVAYHGSPYDFDEFSNDKIGTGEGAQAYGHGLYFTDKKDIAEHYRKKLSSPERTIEQKARDTYNEFDEPEEAEDALLARTDLSANERALLEQLKADDWLGFDYPHQAVRAAMGKIDNFDPSPELRETVARLKAERAGRTYQVDLAPADDEYLLWDKPLSEQSEKVKAALATIFRKYFPKAYDQARFGTSMTGQGLYEHIAPGPLRERASAKAASDELHAAGIRGIKYLAGESRNKGEGTYNYVIFDPADIKITGKFAVAPREDTPEFKRWFGASKVVDARGKPRVLYHETTGEKATGISNGGFDPNKVGARGSDEEMPNGIFLKTSGNPIGLTHGDEAQMPVYAAIENPLHVRDRAALSRWMEKHSPEAVAAAQAMRSEDNRRARIFDERWNALKGVRDERTHQEFMDWSGPYIDEWKAELSRLASTARQLVTEAIRSAGHDGLWMQEDSGSFGRKVETVVAFTPTQVKSATGNRGTFDPSNPDIRYAVAPSGSFDLPDDNRRRAFNRAVLDSFEALRLTPELDRAISLRPGLAYGHAERVQAQTIRWMIDVAKKVGREKADEYLYALHAPTRNAIIAERSKGKFGLESNPGSGMSNSEAARIVKAAGPELTKLRDLNRRLNRERLDTLEKAGLLSEEQRTEWEKFGPDYVPLRTAEDPETRFGSTGSLNVVGPESKRAEGRKSKADSPMVFAVMSFTQAVERAERNRVGQMLADFVEANPTSEWGVYTSRDAIPEGHEVLSLKRDGAPVFIGTSNEAIATAFKQMDVAKAMGVMKAAGLFRRYMHNVIIKYNPAFSFSNAFRDIGTASAKLAITDGVKEAAKVVAYAPAAMRGSWSAIRKEGEGGVWGDWYREARDSGALVGWNEMASFQAVEDAMKQGRRAAILTLLEQANRSVELGSRVASYRVLREAGAAKDVAAQKSRDITTDFARRGNYSSQISSLYLFFNANVQGTASMWRAAAAHPVRAAGVMGSLATVGYLLAVASRLYGDDYDKLTEMQKRRMGGFMVGDTMYGVPLPYGFDVFFYLGSRLETALSGQRTPDSMGEDVLEAVLQSFSPVQGANLGQALTPTIARPAMEIMQNQDFAGVPIRPQQSPFDRSPTPRSEQFFASVDPTLRKATAAMNRATGGDTVRSGAVDISPEDVEHVIKFLGGGVGSLIQRTVTAVLKGGDVRASDIPIMRTFMGQAPESAIARIYYENLTAIEQETDARKKGEEIRDKRALELVTFARNVDKRVKRLRELSKQNPEREKEYRATMREAMETLNLRMMQQ